MKTTELALKIIVNDNLSQALQNYLQNIINSLKEEEEKEYYKVRQSNIHSGIFNEEERKEIENYIAYCGWPRKLDNLIWCKMPVKLTRKGRAFYEKVV